MALTPDQALLEATFGAMKKSGVVWVGGLATWLLWHQGSVVVARGGSEQALPGLVDGGSTTVTVPSPSSRARQLTFTADVRLLDGDERAAVVPLLLDKRLNLPGAREATFDGVEVLRLTPRFPLDEAVAVGGRPARFA